jgi:predicted  nucleic acid-binding Zn-ribbon protein
MTLRRPANPKSVAWAAGLLALGLGLFLWWHFYLGGGTAGPLSPRQVQRQVWRYLKRQSGTSKFGDAAVNFNLRQELAAAQTNLIVLREEMALLQTNLARAQSDMRSLQTTNQNLREKQTAAAQELRQTREGVAEREKRLTNRLAEFALAGTNVLRATTNAEACRKQVETWEGQVLRATNEITDLSQSLSNLNIRIASLQTNLAASKGESRARAAELAAKQQQLKLAQADLAARKQRLEKKTNDTVLAEALAAGQTNAARLEQEVTRLKAEAGVVGQELTNRLENLSALQKEAGGLQKGLNTRREELSSLRRQAADRRQELSQRERGLAAAQAALDTSQSNLSSLQTNLGAWQETLGIKQSVLEARQKEFQAGTNALAARQKEAAAMASQLEARRKELPERQKAIATMQEALRYQVPNFRAQASKQVAEAASYERIYLSIGKQLYVADRLLAGRDPAEHQQALSLAVQSSQQALQKAEQGWLAARICEGWILPNIGLADVGSRSDYAPESLLVHCQNIFEGAGESQNVVRALRLTLDRAQGAVPLKLDAARYQLGYALERAGQYDEALALYRAIESSNYVVAADPHVGAIHRLKAQPALPTRTGN